MNSSPSTSSLTNYKGPCSFLPLVSGSRHCSSPLESDRPGHGAISGRFLKEARHFYFYLRPPDFSMLAICLNFLIQCRGQNVLPNLVNELMVARWKGWVFSSVQSLSRVRLFATPRITARQASLSITNSWSSLRFTSIKSVMPSSHLSLCRPLLLLPPIPPNIKVFSNESTLRMRWPKYWSFSFSIIPSKEIPGLISFRMDCLDLLAVQGTLKSLLQHHS